MVQQCSENPYLWEHFTVYMCEEWLNIDSRYTAGPMHVISLCILPMFYSYQPW
jgi:hypothetical protein